LKLVRLLGDWEGDTVEGGGKKGYIAAFVDLCTKFLISYPLPTKETLGLVKGAKHAFARVPAEAVITCTVDNGKEFAAHSQLGIAIGGDIFFAHPSHSWERGLNEHTNGLLRQYFPKKMPLYGHYFSHFKLEWAFDKRIKSGSVGICFFKFFPPEKSSRKNEEKKEGEYTTDETCWHSLRTGCSRQ
jgi:hypothetical protein